VALISPELTMLSPGSPPSSAPPTRSTRAFGPKVRTVGPAAAAPALMAPLSTISALSKVCVSKRSSVAFKSCGHLTTVNDAPHPFPPDGAEPVPDRGSDK
jgi:hypothetical protein